MCTNLTSLTVDLTAATSKTSFLTDVKAKDLHTLSFRTFMRPGGRPPELDALSHILKDPIFSGVKHLQILYMDGSTVRTMHDAIRDNLPGLYSRGMLSVLDGNLAN